MYTQVVFPGGIFNDKYNQMREGFKKQKQIKNRAQQFKSVNFFPNHEFPAKEDLKKIMNECSKIISENENENQSAIFFSLLNKINLQLIFKETTITPLKLFSCLIDSIEDEIINQHDVHRLIRYLIRHQLNFIDLFFFKKGEKTFFELVYNNKKIYDCIANHLIWINYNDDELFDQVIKIMCKSTYGDNLKFIACDESFNPNKLIMDETSGQQIPLIFYLLKHNKKDSVKYLIKNKKFDPNVSFNNHNLLTYLIQNLDLAHIETLCDSHTKLDNIISKECSILDLKSRNGFGLAHWNFYWRS
jgi:hemerythrin-like domain-containing protein